MFDRCFCTFSDVFASSDSDEGGRECCVEKDRNCSGQFGLHDYQRTQRSLSDPLGGGDLCAPYASSHDRRPGRGRVVYGIGWQGSRWEGHSEDLARDNIDQNLPSVCISAVPKTDSLREAYQRTAHAASDVEKWVVILSDGEAYG